MPKHWTSEEKTYLEDNWGSKSIRAIASKLDRNVSSVQQKAIRMGLGDARFNYDGITLCQLARALNKTYTSLKPWIDKYGMPVRTKIFCQTNRVRVIDYKDFWKWAEGHKELINLAKLEPNILGAEPAWAKVKRKADIMRSQKTWQSVDWTPGEDQRLAQILKTGITYPELAAVFNRSESSVRRRIYDLNLNIKPRRSGNRKYEPGDVETLVRMAEAGYGYETIGKELGKSAGGVRGKLERMGFDFKRRKLKELAK